MSASRQQLDAARNASRSARVRYCEGFDRRWHRVIPGTVDHETYLTTCTGARVYGRTAVDLPREDICAACNVAEKRGDSHE